MVLAGLAWSGQAICPGMVLARLATGFPDFYILTEAFGPGVDPSLPQSDQALDARAPPDPDNEDHYTRPRQQQTILKNIFGQNSNDEIQ